jgi:CRISPR/Cas system-associated protein Cas10 (large subunit of type III CRISPR-Cas system)
LRCQCPNLNFDELCHSCLLHVTIATEIALFIMYFCTCPLPFCRTLCTVENVVSSNGIEQTKNGSVSDADSDDSDVICLDDEPKSVQPPVQTGSQ